MKKNLSKLIAITMAFGFIISPLWLPIQAQAANESGIYLNDTRFLTCLHGQTDNGKEIVIALYEKKGGDDIAYINDGAGHVYTSYVVQDAYRMDIGACQQYTFGGTLIYDFFTVNGTPCLIAGDGTIYACEYLDSYTVSQIMNYD